MTETAAEQRARILTEVPETDPVDYDLAIALGYVAESWDGMWMLPAKNPFSYRLGCVIAREHISPTSRVTRAKAHRLPDGWRLVEDQRLTEAEPRIMFVPPKG
jgi:hypothetical protein